MKTITLKLPETYVVPVALFELGPDEVGAVITIGVESVLAGQQNALLLSETAVETRIRETYESRIQQLMSQIGEQERQRKCDQESFLSQQTQFKEVFYKDNERLREAIAERDVRIKTMELAKCANARLPSLAKKSGLSRLIAKHLSAD